MKVCRELAPLCGAYFNALKMVRIVEIVPDETDAFSGIFRDEYLIFFEHGD
jgi:hypothetical protein